ncbi:MAG: stage III sporulation protein AA [Firmicutes bacterium]|nr:stage III sporulation protein AA [Dethiobacter sp.]MBS3898157.1 stage III sporulation protein AA [Dethiobacter sp.]MCL4464061.1 stage III sporulation protein AA [Bacillota bacterium]MCL5993077.1 stage III sporulation protein AA [Bacillota bacterium]
MAKMEWKNQILPILPARLQNIFATLSGQAAEELEEIRLRSGKAIMICTHRGESFVGLDGVTGNFSEAVIVTAAELQAVLLTVAEYSLYARDEELRRGYLALPGGHRAGFAGRVVLEENRVKLLRDISGISLRIAREVKGAGEALLPQLFCTRQQRVYHTLLVSAPQAGKTTMLRDLARLFSDGDQVKGRFGLKVGIVDERSELAGCYLGVPQLDVGMRSDVLDGCPKAEGMMMLVRSMSPQLLVTDELGRPEDARAVEEAVNSGASILATVHGHCLGDLMKRPSLAYLLRQTLFERIVFLSRRKGPGTIEEIYNGETVKSRLVAEEMGHVV